MRSLLSCSLITTMLLFTVTTASAGYIKSADMEVIKSPPMVGGTRYADIDAVSNPMGGSTEIFCVEKMPALKGVNRYDFYTIDQTNYYDKHGTDITAVKVAQLKRASWYANWFLNISSGTDNEKAIAQIAIWGAVDAIKNYNGPLAEEVAELLELYLLADDKDAYVSEWALAVSPGDGTPIVWGELGQNFLVHIAKTPEPATAATLSIGLLTMAGIFRSRKVVIE